MYKQIQSVFLLFFLSLVAASAQEKPNNIPDKLDNSLLWELSGKGIKKSYIFGTIHMISEKDFFMDDRTMKAIKKCKKIRLVVILLLKERF